MRTRSLACLLFGSLSAAALAAPLALTGCGGFCTAEAIAGVSVVVTEAGTSKPIPDATVTLRDGDYVEVIAPQDRAGNYYSGAWERAGVYVVEVAAKGYRPVTLDKVRVSEDDCHVETRSLDVALTPE